MFVDELDLSVLDFTGAVPEATCRPAYHPATLLTIYLYGYLNRLPSSLRLARESHRNIKLIWLTGRLMPDFKTLDDFRKDNGPAIQSACAQFVVLCRRLNLFSKAVVMIDGSKFRAVNNRDKNLTVAKVEARLAQVEVSIARYLAALDRADREPRHARRPLNEKITRLREQMQALQTMDRQVEAAPDGQVSLADPDARSTATSGKGTGMVGYNVQATVDTEHHLVVAHAGPTSAATGRDVVVEAVGKERDLLTIFVCDEPFHPDLPRSKLTRPDQRPFTPLDPQQPFPMCGLSGFDHRMRAHWLYSVTAVTRATPATYLATRLS